MYDWSKPFNQQKFEEVLKPFMVLDNDKLNKNLNTESIIIYASSKKNKKGEYNDRERKIIRIY